MSATRPWAAWAMLQELQRAMARPEPCHITEGKVVAAFASVCTETIPHVVSWWVNRIGRSRVMQANLLCFLDLPLGFLEPVSWQRGGSCFT